MNDTDIDALNDLSGFLSFKKNFILEALLECEQNIIFIETGNQAGKTASVMKFYAMRILGMCPIERRNLRPNNPFRIIRLGSQTLPMEADENGEVKNTVYPRFKEFFPNSYIEKDITIRKPTVSVRDPQGGKNIILEYVSYGQQVQSQAGVQRFSIYLDEQSPQAFYEEQLPRLLASNGDIIIGLTPVQEMTWTYDELYQRTEVIYNSSTIIKYYKDKYGITLPRKQLMGNKTGIATIRAATDDNPIMDEKSIEERLIQYRDKSTREMRRYGIFHQVSDVIYQSFDESVHKISKQKYFLDGIPHQWLHARGIDFHTHVDWAVGWIVLSPQNEAFIYNEYNPSPTEMITLEIAREIISRTGDYKINLNLIDPIAADRQVNTGLTPLDDLNRTFYEFKRQNFGTGGYWQTWDTKNLIGKEIIKERLNNSRLCGRPFNNRVFKDGRETYLPTLWILDNCPVTIYMFRNWKWDTWARREALVTKEEKNKEQDKYSHFPKTYECIFKHPGFRIVDYNKFRQRESPHGRYMQARV